MQSRILTLSQAKQGNHQRETGGTLRLLPAVGDRTLEGNEVGGMSDRVGGLSADSGPLSSWATVSRSLAPPISRHTQSATLQNPIMWAGKSEDLTLVS